MEKYNFSLFLKNLAENKKKIENFHLTVVWLEVNISTSSPSMFIILRISAFEELIKKSRERSNLRAKIRDKKVHNFVSNKNSIFYYGNGLLIKTRLSTPMKVIS